VTNLPHCSSNVAIRHNDATRRCDGDVTLRRDFALSRHNRQRWRVLGHIGWYRARIDDYATQAQPLTNLIRKNVKF
jgi:hypothetical protein